MAYRTTRRAGLQAFVAKTIACERKNRRTARGNKRSSKNKTLQTGFRCFYFKKPLALPVVFCVTFPAKSRFLLFDVP
jgi:hypothetical protein